MFSPYTHLISKYPAFECFITRRISDLTEEEFDAITALPDDEFIIGLESLFDDSFQLANETEDFEDADTDIFFFVLAALLARTEPRLEPLVRKLFGAGEEFIDFYLGEISIEAITGLVYRYYNENLPRIKEVVLNPDNDEYMRWWFADALSVIIHLTPERTPEITAFIKELFSAVLKDEKLKQEDVINNVLAGIAAQTKAPEMEQELTTFLGSVESDEDINGSLDEILELLKSDYEDFVFQRFEGYDLIIFARVLGADDEDDDDRFSDGDQGPYRYYDEDQGQASNPFKSIGRNDPCPCGSGKKFKSCHWAEMKG